MRIETHWKWPGHRILKTTFENRAVLMRLFNLALYYYYFYFPLSFHSLKISKNNKNSAKFCENSLSWFNEQLKPLRKIKTENYLKNLWILASNSGQSDQSKVQNNNGERQLYTFAIYHLPKVPFLSMNIPAIFRKTRQGYKDQPFI